MSLGETLLASSDTVTRITGSELVPRSRLYRNCRARPLILDTDRYGDTSQLWSLKKRDGTKGVLVGPSLVAPGEYGLFMSCDVQQGDKVCLYADEYITHPQSIDGRDTSYQYTALCYCADGTTVEVIADSISGRVGEGYANVS